MELIDNINILLGDTLKTTIRPGAKLKIAASCFSIYAYEVLKHELEKIESFEFIFTSPTFVPDEVTDKLKRERREFYIPKTERELGFYGTEFEIQLKNKLTQKAIAKECAAWIKRKASFRSNRSKSPMQKFACIQHSDAQHVYVPLDGFTAVDLGYQQGDATSNILHQSSEASTTAQYLKVFDQIWNDKNRVEDVTQNIYEHPNNEFCWLNAHIFQRNRLFFCRKRSWWTLIYQIFHCKDEMIWICTS